MHDVSAHVAADLDSEQWETLAAIAKLDSDLWTLERLNSAVAGALGTSYAVSRRRVEDLAIPALQVFALELESAKSE